MQFRVVDYPHVGVEHLILVHHVLGHVREDVFADVLLYRLCRPRISVFIKFSVPNPVPVYTAADRVSYSRLSPPCFPQNKVCTVDITAVTYCKLFVRHRTLVESANLLQEYILVSYSFTFQQQHYKVALPAFSRDSATFC